VRTWPGFHPLANIRIADLAVLPILDHSAMMVQEIINGMPTTILKVSVLLNGSVLLDGNAVTLAEFAGALSAGPNSGTVVWYYTERMLPESPRQRPCK
jgi:hypothetical protein